VTHLLVAYASRHGSTQGVAERIGARLRECGAGVGVRRVEDPDLTGIGHYDAVVLGSPVYSRRWLPEADRFRGGPRRPARRASGVALQRGDLRGGVIDRHQWPFFSRLFFWSLGGRLGDNRDWDEIDAWARGIAEAALPERRSGPTICEDLTRPGGKAPKP